MPKPLIKIGVIVACVGAFALYLWWSMRVPPPREQDRVTHRDGIFSIIKPRDWDVEFNYAPANQRYIDTMEVRFPTSRPRDLRIFIGRFRAPPDLATIAARDRLVSDQFQGRPAHVFVGRTRLEYYWRAIFQRGDDWYELVFWMPFEDDVAKSGWWPYLNSFRARETPTTNPTTSNSISLYTGGGVGRGRCSG
jgi:hypothetical protein